MSLPAYRKNSSIYVGFSKFRSIGAHIFMPVAEFVTVFVTMTLPKRGTNTAAESSLLFTLDIPYLAPLLGSRAKMSNGAHNAAGVGTDVDYGRADADERMGSGGIGNRHAVRS